MSIEIWFAFALASVALLAIPGPTILTVVSYSIAQGRRANIPLVAAVALGDSTALLFSLLGLVRLNYLSACSARCRTRAPRVPRVSLPVAWRCQPPNWKIEDCNEISFPSFSSYIEVECAAINFSSQHA